MLLLDVDIVLNFQGGLIPKTHHHYPKHFHLPFSHAFLDEENAKVKVGLEYDDDSEGYKMSKRNDRKSG